MKGFLFAAAIAVSALLAGCATAPNGNVTIFGQDTGINQANAQADVQSALNTACPVYAALVPSLPPNLSTVQKAAVQTLAGICPPNPPPTNAVVAATDILAAYEALQPLLAKK